MALPFTLKPALLLSVLHNRKWKKNKWGKTQQDRKRAREREKRGGRGKTGHPSFPLMFPMSSSPHADNGVIRHAELWFGGVSVLAKGGRGEIKGV